MIYQVAIYRRYQFTGDNYVIPDAHIIRHSHEEAEEEAKRYSDVGQQCVIYYMADGEVIAEHYELHRLKSAYAFDCDEAFDESREAAEHETQGV